MADYDFSGWATKNDLRCSDGRTIRKNAFVDCDGKSVPLVWNHRHNDPSNTLGHAMLENREDGVYAYCSFNNSEYGKTAKELVRHGDIKSLSIYANQLKQVGGDVIHGMIREVSLVLAGANPGATIDFITHSEDGTDGEPFEVLDGFTASYDECGFILCQSDENEVDKNEEDNKDKEEKKEMADTKKTDKKTVGDVLDELTEEQRNVVYALIGDALNSNDDKEDDKDTEEEDKKMKHNLFDSETDVSQNVISHKDQVDILNLAKQSSVGSFKEACAIYAEKNELEHGAIDGEVFGTLLPDYKDIRPGEPETLTDDTSWIAGVINGVHKSPVSRIRMRQLDTRGRRNRAKGYKKGTYKEEGSEAALLQRTFDPQTIFTKDSLHRDDVIDFTDFDLVGYQWKIMRAALNEELATAILIGDGRDLTDPDKIKEDHIRSIWNDDELFTLHYDVDLETAKTSVQGNNTDDYFSENYIFAEAIIEKTLYAREKYKGSGNLDFYCTPHTVNVMLLARDRNGRRIYSSVKDLEAALNVRSIKTVEQFEGLIREDANHNKHQLLGLFVNLSDYTLGATKGGEITKFEAFDIDFNKMQMMLETRCSGALTRVASAIALEIPVSNG